MLRNFNRKKSRLIECNAPIIGISVTDMARDHCIYELWKNDQLFYLGCCQFSLVYKVPDLKSNGYFLNNVTMDEPLSIVIKYVGSRVDCYNQRGKMLRSVMPECNRNMLAIAKTFIMCNEDGKKYRSQAEIVEVYGIKASNLSNHLSGKSGFNTVNGRTFTRVIAGDDE